MSYAFANTLHMKFATSVCLTTEKYAHNGDLARHSTKATEVHSVHNGTFLVVLQELASRSVHENDCVFAFLSV